MKCDVAVLTSGNTTRYEIDLTQGLAGPRSFWGGIPEVGSVVVLGYRRKHKKLFEAVIVGYLPVGNKTGARFDPYGATNPSEISPEDQELYNQIYGPPVRYKRLLMEEGDVGGMSSRGSELVLSTDLQGCNRAGDGFHFRDTDRTFLATALWFDHRSSGHSLIAGGVRRRKLFLPSALFSSEDRSPAEGYLGSSILQEAGAGDSGGPFKMLSSEGILGEKVNNESEFPPVTYSDGSRAFYVGIDPSENPESPDATGQVFVEHAFRLDHTTDLVPPVTVGHEGFEVDRTLPFVTLSHGTLVGDEPWTTQGMRLYGKILKPSLFTDFRSFASTRFTLNPVNRTPTNADIEAYTQAAAFYYRMLPPRGDDPFVVSVSKQGKLFLQVPGSSVEDQTSKNISLEALFLGAIKAKVGASAPDRVSLNLALDGGIHADIGSDSSGRAVTLRFRSSVHQTYQGTPDTDDVAIRTEVQGISQRSVTGEDFETVKGSKLTTVNGRYQMEADRLVVNAISGFSGNYGEKNELVSGKTQINYALQVLENIVAGGKILTILAGGYTDTVTAGARITNVLGGAFSTNVAAGAYTVTVGTGAISVTTGAGAIAVSTGAGAMSLAAGGAISISAGLALNLAASTIISLTSPQILLGGPLSVLGVVRGAPSLPPGAPSLDFFLNIPFLGSALVRSI